VRQNAELRLLVQKLEMDNSNLNLQKSSLSPQKISATIQSKPSDSIHAVDFPNIELQQLKNQLAALGEKLESFSKNVMPATESYAQKTKQNVPRQQPSSETKSVPLPPSPSTAGYLIFQNLQEDQAQSREAFADTVNSFLFDKGLFPRILPSHILTLTPYAPKPNSYLIQFCSVRLAKDVFLCKKAFTSSKVLKEKHLYIYPLLTPKERNMVNSKVSQFIKLQSQELDFKVYSNGFDIKLVNTKSKAKVFYNALSTIPPSDFFASHQSLLFPLS
jgi:hypothetical protein